MWCILFGRHDIFPLGDAMYVTIDPDEPARYVQQLVCRQCAKLFYAPRDGKAFNE